MVLCGVSRRRRWRMIRQFRLRCRRVHHRRRGRGRNHGGCRRRSAGGEVRRRNRVRRQNRRSAGGEVCGTRRFRVAMSPIPTRLSIPPRRWCLTSSRPATAVQATRTTEPKTRTSHSRSPAAVRTVGNDLQGGDEDEVYIIYKNSACAVGAPVPPNGTTWGNSSTENGWNSGLHTDWHNSVGGTAIAARRARSHDVTINMLLNDNQRTRPGEQYAGTANIVLNPADGVKCFVAAHFDGSLGDGHDSNTTSAGFEVTLDRTAPSLTAIRFGTGNGATYRVWATDVSTPVTARTIDNTAARMVQNHRGYHADRMDRLHTGCKYQHGSRHKRSVCPLYRWGGEHLGETPFGFRQHRSNRRSGDECRSACGQRFRHGRRQYHQ